LNSYTLNAIASRSAVRCFSAASVASLRAAMFAHSCSGVCGDSPSSASKIGAVSAMDLLARVTICLPTGARSAS
jgi:hypothetical protein